jgi:hypothetical protein
LLIAPFTGALTMGEIADMYFEHWLDSLFEDEAYYPPPHCWKTQDGTIIAFADMTTQHLQNTLDMLIRKGYGVGNQLFEEMLDEYESRSDHTTDWRDAAQKAAVRLSSPDFVTKRSSPTNRRG